MTNKVVKKRVTTETVDDEGNLKTIVKEHAPKEVKKKKRTKSSSSGEKKMSAREREELLVENFVGLQHAMTNMSIKFGALSDNISKLLQIFEESAKNFVGGGRPDDEEMLKKIDSLLNQNKTIAKGLVLMEGKLRGRSEMESPRDEGGFSPNMSPQNYQPPMSRPNISGPNFNSNPNSSGPSPQSTSTPRPKPLPSI